MTIQTKDFEQCFSVVLFGMLLKVVLAIESVNDIPKCDHSIQMKQLLSSTFTRCCLLRLMHKGGNSTYVKSVLQHFKSKAIKGTGNCTKFMKGIKEF